MPVTCGRSIKNMTATASPENIIMTHFLLKPNMGDNKEGKALKFKEIIGHL